MSNILIGIIGVILFIGLALAGALFLGPRFQESTQNSRAAAYVQALSQISSAMALYRLNEGTDDTSVQSVEQLVSSGYMKTMPKILEGTPAVGNDAGTTVTIRIFETPEPTCRAINVQTSGSSTIPTGPTQAVGCYLLNGTKYFVYSKIR